jgi:hypothetical protein
MPWGKQALHEFKTGEFTEKFTSMALEASKFRHMSHFYTSVTLQLTMARCSRRCGMDAERREK